MLKADRMYVPDAGLLDSGDRHRGVVIFAVAHRAVCRKKWRKPQVWRPGRSLELAHREGLIRQRIRKIPHGKDRLRHPVQLSNLAGSCCSTIGGTSTGAAAAGFFCNCNCRSLIWASRSAICLLAFSNSAFPRHPGEEGAGSGSNSFRQEQASRRFSQFLLQRVAGPLTTVFNFVCNWAMLADWPSD